MSVLENDIMRYFTGEEEALLRIAKRCAHTVCVHRKVARMLCSDRSLEEDDVVSWVAEITWKFLAREKFRDATMLFRRIVFEVTTMLRDVKTGVDYVGIEGTEEPVVDDEEMFLLRYDLRYAAEKLRVGPREKKAAKMLVDCWPRSEIIASCGYTEQNFRQVLSRTIYPKMREALSLG